jgi:sugar lactone lactonase YvrE
MHRIVSILAALVLLVACSKKEKETQKPQENVEKAAVEKTAGKTEKKVEPKAEEPKASAPEPTTAKPVEKPEPKKDKKTVIKVSGVGFATPESVIFDPEMDVYYVSNINGSPLAADGNGFISRIFPNGKVVDLKWIDGAKEGFTLNAPKGMAISGRTLFVADLNYVRMFDCEATVSTGNLKIQGSTFLNDIALGLDGELYVSDSGFKGGEKGFVPSGTDAVYRISPNGKAARVLAKNEELGRPNGLLVQEDGVWVVSFGSGEIYMLDKKGKRSRVHKSEKGKLDGLMKAADGELIFSSWDAKAIYKGPAGGPYKVVVANVEAPAGIGYDFIRKQVLIPLFKSHAVEIHPI